MNVDTSFAHSPEITGMLARLVNEFGYPSAQAAVCDALANLIEDRESETPGFADCDEEVVASLQEALDDIEQGDKGRPASEVFDELRREFNIPKNA